MTLQGSFDSLLSRFEHVEVRPAKTGLLIGLIQILLLFSDECRDVLATCERIFDVSLKVQHRFAEALADRLVRGTLREILPLVRVFLQIE